MQHGYNFQSQDSSSMGFSYSWTFVTERNITLIGYDTATGLFSFFIKSASVTLFK
jgi:hypothetical protein